jgi:competence protein ComEA
MEAVPRPAPDAPRAELAERWQRWRADPRIAVVVLSCVAIAAGVAWFRTGIAPASPAGGDSAVIEAGRDAGQTGSSVPGASSSTTSTTTAAIVVDVVGAVHRTGVVILPTGSRVVDAIDAAGGPVAGADLTRLNLAAVLGDGARVAVPLVGQPPPAVDPSAVTGAASATGGAISTGAGAAEGAAVVNVNTATAEELETLPGVGPATAAAIIRERDANGPFATVDDLDRVRGIGSAKLEQLRDLVAV